MWCDFGVVFGVGVVSRVGVVFRVGVGVGLVFRVGVGHCGSGFGCGVGLVFFSCPLRHGLRRSLPCDTVCAEVFLRCVFFQRSCMPISMRVGKNLRLKKH